MDLAYRRLTPDFTFHTFLAETLIASAVIYACTTFGLCFFSGVFLSSGVTGACPVTTDLIMRVNVTTTTTTRTPFRGDVAAGRAYAVLSVVCAGRATGGALMRRNAVLCLLISVRVAILYTPIALCMHSYHAPICSPCHGSAAHSYRVSIFLGILPTRTSIFYQGDVLVVPAVDETCCDLWLCSDPADQKSLAFIPCVRTARRNRGTNSSTRGGKVGCRVGKGVWAQRGAGEDI